ncbi:MAG: hypothetical protein U0V72_04715 [Cytophagales bacterium]
MREIRNEEIILIQHLLELSNLNPENYKIPSFVDEYEGGIMGSIGMGSSDPTEYAGDIIQVKYMDTDDIPVIITLTHNHNNELLDLDFWKEDFSKLLQYPEPTKVQKT